MATTPNMKNPFTITDAELDIERERLWDMIRRDFGDQGFSQEELQYSFGYLFWDRWYRPKGCKWTGGERPARLIPFAMSVRPAAPHELPWGGQVHAISTLGVPLANQAKRTLDNTNGEAADNTMRDQKRPRVSEPSSQEPNAPQPSTFVQNSPASTAQEQIATQTNAAAKNAESAAPIERLNKMMKGVDYLQGPNLTAKGIEQTLDGIKEDVAFLIAFLSSQAQ